MTQPPVTRFSSGGRLCWALLAVFTVYLLAGNRSYHILDQRPPTFDDAWYLETSLQFYNRLTRSGFIDFLSAYASSFRTKAPLISVLPLPFYLLFGTRYHTAILVNFLFIAIANLYLFLLGRRLFSAGVGLAAVIFYQTMPLVFGLSRVFMADYGLSALVIVWMYCLAASERLTCGRANFLLGVILGFGLLMKVLFPVYIAGPFLVALLSRRRGAPRPAPDAAPAPYSLAAFWRACAGRPLAAIAIPGAAVASTWYGFHLASILRYAWQAGYGEIGEQYGGANLKHWMILVINQGIGFYYAAGLLILGPAALAVSRMRWKWKEHTWMLLTWLALPLCAIAAGSNREIRFVIPLLPVPAILLAVSAFELGRRPLIQAVLVLLLSIFPLRLYAALSSHGPEHHGPDHPVHFGPYVLFSRDLGWARAPDSRGRWGQERILAALEQMGPAPATPRYVVLGIEHPYLNSNLLRYLNAYREYPLRYTSLGYAESSAASAIERLYSLDARFLIMGEGFHNYDLPAFLNQVNNDIQERLNRGELPFRLRAKVSLTGKFKAVIYEKESPWVRWAPGAKAETPSHPLTVDFAGGPRFLGYDWKPRDHYLQNISYYWTVPHPIHEDYRVHVEFRRGGHVVLAQDHYIADGQHPFYDWQPGEIVKQTISVYLPSGGEDDPPEARLWLSAWGLGAAQQITSPKEMIHESVIPLKLE
jgi:4-amino-4-deoxy-L-arabinose transferase-like glycosyltransferase